jgi:RNA polymerase sigma-70 factor (ECF subfamily)
MNDLEAVKLAQEKREDGYKAIFENHSSFLFTHALRFLKNPEAAEDSVQEALHDAFRFINGFKGNSSLRTWLYKILYRKMLRQISKNKTEPMIIEPGVTDSTYHNVELKLDTTEILDQLPERDRSLLMLAYWDELKIEEIADILQISLSNAKISLFRARKKFGERWQQNRRKGENANEL